jgi:hypothetical protein
VSNRKKIRSPGGDPGDDQIGAAAAEAFRKTRTGGPLGPTLDLSAAAVLEDDDIPPVSKRLFRRFTTTMTTTRLDPCPHVERAYESRSAIPLHWALWRPGRVACERCMPLWLETEPGYPTESYCDVCHQHKPTDYLQFANGPFIIHADVCDDCKASPDEQLDQEQHR